MGRFPTLQWRFEPVFFWSSDNPLGLTINSGTWQGLIQDRENEIAAVWPNWSAFWDVDLNNEPFGNATQPTLPFTYTAWWTAGGNSWWLYPHTYAVSGVAVAAYPTTRISIEQYGWEYTINWGGDPIQNWGGQGSNFVPVVQWQSKNMWDYTIESVQQALLAGTRIDGLGFESHLWAIYMYSSVDMKFRLWDARRLGLIPMIGEANSNTKLATFGNVILITNSTLRWRNNGVSAFASGSVIPTNLISFSVSGSQPRGGSVELDGIDFSSIVTGKTLFSAMEPVYFAIARNCKLGSGGTFTATPTFPGINVFNYNCDVGSSNYRSEKYDYYGIETTNTSVTRVGGASDGITSQSRQLATSANAGFSSPLISMPMMIWNDLVGSTRNVTVYGTINAASPPANNELWLEAEYFEDSASPMASFVNDRMAYLATPASQTADVASTWNGGGSGAGWSPFKLSVSLTAQQHGYIVCRVKAAKASTTYYIDPPGAGTLS